MQSIIKMLKNGCTAFKMQAFYRRMERIALLIVEHTQLPCDPNKDPSFMRLYTIQMLGEQCLGSYNGKFIQIIEQTVERLAPFLKKISLPKTYYIKPAEEEIRALVKKVLTIKATLEKEGMRLDVKAGFFYFSMNCVRKHLENFQPIPWRAVEHLVELTQTVFADIESSLKLKRQEELFSRDFLEKHITTSDSCTDRSLSPLPLPSVESHSSSSSSSGSNSWSRSSLQLKIPECVSQPLKLSSAEFTSGSSFSDMPLTSFSLETQPVSTASASSSQSKKGKKRKRSRPSVPSALFSSSSNSAFTPFDLLPKHPLMKTLDTEVREGY
jgi:hypothetical protein